MYYSEIAQLEQQLDESIKNGDITPEEAHEIMMNALHVEEQNRNNI